MHNINYNAIQVACLSENYSTRKIIARNILDMKHLQFMVHASRWWSLVEKYKWKNKRLWTVAYHLWIHIFVEDWNAYLKPVSPVINVLYSLVRHDGMQWSFSIGLGVNRPGIPCFLLQSYLGSLPALHIHEHEPVLTNPDNVVWP